MNRREVLKGLSLSLGYIVATPTVLNLLQSCKTDVAIWTPVFLTKEEGVVIKNLIDLILPETFATPGALEVNVPEFIDVFAAKASSEEDQKKFKEGLSAILKALQQPTSKLKTEDYDALLAKYLKASKEEREILKASKEDSLVLKALEGLRSSSVWAYKTSQKIGEEVLAYDPIPGVQLGCISLKETTGGKAWSL